MTPPFSRGPKAGTRAATPPATFGEILTGLTRAGLSRRGEDRRIVVEKPLGQDAESAHKLNQQLEALFDDVRSGRKRFLPYQSLKLYGSDATRHRRDSS